MWGTVVQVGGSAVMMRTERGSQSGLRHQRGVPESVPHHGRVDKLALPVQARFQEIRPASVGGWKHQHEFLTFVHPANACFLRSQPSRKSTRRGPCDVLFCPLFALVTEWKCIKPGTGSPFASIRYVQV